MIIDPLLNILKTTNIIASFPIHFTLFLPLLVHITGQLTNIIDTIIPETQANDQHTTPVKSTNTESNRAINVVIEFLDVIITVN